MNFYFCFQIHDAPDPFIFFQNESWEPWVIIEITDGRAQWKTSLEKALTTRRQISKLMREPLYKTRPRLQEIELAFAQARQAFKNYSQRRDSLGL